MSDSISLSARCCEVREFFSAGWERYLVARPAASRIFSATPLEFLLDRLAEVLRLLPVEARSLFFAGGDMVIEKRKMMIVECGMDRWE